MPADDARPVLPSRTIGPLASDDPESEPPLRKGEGPGHRPTGQATLASHAARRPLLDGPRTGCRDDLVCAQPRHGRPLARSRPQVRRALLRTHPDPAARARWNAARVRGDISVAPAHTPVEPVVVFVTAHIADVSRSSVTAIEGLPAIVDRLVRGPSDPVRVAV